MTKPLDKTLLSSLVQLDLDRSDRCNRPIRPVMSGQFVSPTSILLTPQPLKPASLSLPHHSLSPALSLIVPSLSLIPKLQILHPNSTSRPRKLQIGVEDLLLHMLLPEVLLISSSSRGKISFKVLQLVLSRSIFLGGSKWFPLVNRLYMHPFTRI